MAPTLVVALFGCGPKEMGAKAPAFGVSPQLSTTAGFLEGSWKSKVDESTARFKQPFFTGLIPDEYLDFRHDHTCTFTLHHHSAHMTWKESSNGVDLTVVDVDGIAASRVKAAYDKWESYSRYDVRRTLREVDFMRGTVLDMAGFVKRLELMPDKKRLFEPSGVHADGSTFMGTSTWVRLH
ncbi:MAG: hypothetical protein ACYC96_03225 [Fimbriimonadaceae bacterium]